MNPVQFKVDSVNKVKKEVEGMTVFNTNQVNTKKQPMFFGAPLGFRDMIHTNIQFLKN